MTYNELKELKTKFQKMKEYHTNNIKTKYKISDWIDEIIFEKEINEINKKNGIEKKSSL